MVLESPLLERHGETAVLRAAVAAVVRERSGRMVVIEGDAGIGKTRLLRELRTEATASTLGVLWARASWLEQSFGFGVVRQLLARSVPPTTSAAPAPAAVVSARRVLEVAETPDEHATSDRDELARLHGLYWLLAEACREPTAVLVDDAQWADAESLQFLDYLRVRLDGLPVLVVLTMRSGEPGLPARLRTLVDDPDITQLRLAPLGRDGVQGFLDATLEPPIEAGFAEACRSVTAGNPLLLVALAGVVEREGLAPTTASAARVALLGHQVVRRQVERQLQRLDATTRSVAEAAAALGADAPLAIVAAVAAVDELSAAECVAELEQWDLVEPRAGPADTVNYRHSAAAEVVLAQLPERRRQDLRCRCADALEKHGAQPERVAAHLFSVSAGVDGRALPRLLAAAEEAVRRGAPQSALTYLERLLAEDLRTDERQRISARAGALAVQTDLASAIGHLERAVAGPPGRDDPELWGLLGTAQGYLLHPDEAVAAVEHALRLVPPDDDDNRRRWEASLLVAAVVAPGRLDLRDRISRLRDLPPGSGLGARLLDAALSLHETAVADSRGRDRAHAALADGLLVTQANGEGSLVAGWLSLIAADDPLALTCLDDAVQEANEHGSVRALAAALTFRAMARLRAGRLLDAVDDGREGLAHALSGRVDLDPRFAGAYLAQALLAIGDLAEAEQTLASIRAFRDDHTGPRYYAREAAAQLRRLQGRADESLEIAMSAGHAWADYGFDNPALGPWRSEAALAAYGCGQSAYATELAAAELAIARRWAAPGALGRSLRVLGLVTGGDRGIELLEESVLTLRGSPARLELAHSLAAFGAGLRRTGRRTDAQTVLAEALDAAERCGASGLADEVAMEIRAAGSRPRRHRLAGPDALTIGERRVADLAADGASNRTIAQTLFLSQKTVELHLTNAYRKLGIPGRRELAAALRPTGH